MQIYGFNSSRYTVPSPKTGAADARSVSAETQSHESESAEGSHILSGLARDLSDHATDLYVESRRIAIFGEKVAPEDRISLEGVRAEYLANMNDADYLAALRQEELKLRNQSIDLFRQANDIDDPAGKAERDAKLSGKPSLADADEARSVLSSYTDTLVGLIKTRNQLSDYLNSENLLPYLTARYGEDGAKEQAAQIQQTIDAHDKQIVTVITSLNTIFSLTGEKPIATQENGNWRMNGTSGFYVNGGFSYAFDVSTDGTILDR
ncbi:MAG TPA: hypothetical protein VK181_01480 [Rhizobium sp.]|nr:hypothetical protein [Rhizobium sp.]